MPAKLTMRPAVRRCASAGIVALALLGAGLPTSATASADPPQPDLSRFYRQKVTWSACRGAEIPRDLQCGKVTVPLDYARPASGTLDIALARYQATGKSQGSVLLNFGGPGAGGISSLAGAGGKDYLGLTNGYDVVTFDPRGVGRSSPITCDGNSGGSPGTPAEGSGELDTSDPRALLDALRKTAAECTRYSGPVLAHMGTVNASRDMDVMRAALGDKKLNYLGFSYGTRLGAVYAAQFPDKVGRMALDGVDTLTEPLAEQGLAATEAQQTALDDFLDWCVKDIACPFGQDRRRAGSQVLKLVHSLDANPVPSNFGDQFTGQDLVGALGQGLYSRKLWPTLERSLGQLIGDGDTSGVEIFASGGLTLPGGLALPGGRASSGHSSSGRTSSDHPSGDSRTSSGGLVDQADIPVDNLPAALLAINCADDPDRADAAHLTQDIERLRGPYEQASPVFGEYRLTQTLMCYGRPRGTDFIRTQVKDLDTSKILLVGTRGDPATPYRWAEETAARLGSAAVVLDNKGPGHTGYTSSTCVHRKVDDYLLYGSLPPDGSSCGAEGADW
ncbi:alpha/beta hydrolase [Streptomyces sp. V3I7]|uniref:alpha/beta hydrolase n=1 Tax=Streptomyces sp. V3I7 TaxID=3042278 RepID=UPI002789C873|nr:alpha/beta hydrolase [Streptomyces sp. V3I7]MDQ0989057.1 pimeloyl-ACP methyl ester carboxylesterase [Streptomyces sp. V3I7]